MYIETIRAEDIFRYRRSIVLDLREYEKYCKGHIPGAISIPYDSLQDSLQEIKRLVFARRIVRKVPPVIVYCDRGNTSLLASKVLLKEGIPVLNVHGGFAGYHGPVALLQKKI